MRRNYRNTSRKANTGDGDMSVGNDKQKEKLLDELTKLAAEYNKISDCIRNNVRIDFDELHKLDLKKENLIARINDFSRKS
jgi:hypothetical protein